MLALGGRGRPQIEQHRVERAAHTPNQLARSRGRPLEMHAAYRAAAPIPRHARLYEGRWQAVRLELLNAHGAREKPALVGVALHFHQRCTGEPESLEQHVSASKTRRRSAESTAGTSAD